jgi:steroid delta-isomerase-like uncharacterized protein
MQTEENKNIVRRLWVEVWNQNKLNVCDEIFDPGYARHEKAWVPIVRNAFPDTHITIEDMIAEDDRVVTRYIFTGTHQAEFWGIPPTGKSVEIKGIWIHRLANQCIVEGRDWGLMDIYGMMRQLGVSNE